MTKRDETVHAIRYLYETAFHEPERVCYLFLCVTFLLLIRVRKRQGRDNKSRPAVVGVISRVPILVERIGAKVVVEKLGGERSRVVIVGGY